MGSVMLPPPAVIVPDKNNLLTRFEAIRRQSVALTTSLSASDMQIQSMADASPVKWHLAHTSWFFEQMILLPFSPDYCVFSEDYACLFNSYYQGLGQPYTRAQRGLITRPDISEIFAYREWVDKHITRLWEQDNHGKWHDLLILGLAHEQQHQELILSDIKHAFFHNPSYPAYCEPAYCAQSLPQQDTEFLRCDTPGETVPPYWSEFPGGLYEIGHGGEGFAYDNEAPRHKVYLEDFALAHHPVTNAQYYAFMAAGGYQEAKYWLSDGWQWVQDQKRNKPLYWQEKDGTWYHFTLHGLQPVDPQAPLIHVNFYEAQAFAQWAGYRLPSEAEWEVAAAHRDHEGQFCQDGLYHPVRQNKGKKGLQMMGTVWEWTSSAYLPYPGYQPYQGAASEYNGKFMCNQMVLRGGSCWSMADHLRISYRNFFYPHQSWQACGIRLAR